MSDAPRSGVWRDLVTMDRGDLALRLLLVALLFQPIGQRWLRPAVIAVAALGLLSPRALRSGWLWGALAALAAARIASGWPTNDNHAYLLVYWCLAAALAALSLDRDRVLARNARALVAGTFVFATLWKLVLSPDFVDGTFFRVALVDDARFESFTLLAAGIDYDALLALRGVAETHADGVFAPWEGMPAPPPRLLAVADALTIGTLAFEGALALAFLLPLRFGVARARDALLALFCTTTYALAPVPGFGWLLLSMGVAQCEPERRRMRGVYLIAFAAVLFASRWPWLDWLAP